jgi:hypothetical protein
MLAALAPRAAAFPVAGQVAYLAGLFVPAALLLVPDGRAPMTWPRLAWLAPVGAVVALWVGLRLLVDAHSTRAAHVIDTWRTALALATFLGGPGNYVTGGVDPEMPGVPATPLVVLGLPLVQAGLAPLTFTAVRLMHLCTVAATGAAVALAARRLLGGGATIAVAVFLFAPLVRFMAATAGPYAVSSTYAVLIVLAAIAAWRRGSDAALAALGGLCGLAVVHPGLGPTAIAGAAIGAAGGRGHRVPWTTVATAIAAFVAAAWPHVPAALASALDAARSLLDGHAAATLGEVLRSPFAVARTPGRLWGDTLFDPIGAVLLATGLVACLRAAGRSPAATILVLLLAAALLPALVTTAEHPVLLRAFVLPVPGALLAAAGFQSLRRGLAPRGARRLAGAIVAATCVAGTIVFDVVNPRILGTSALALVFQAAGGADAPRAVLLDDATELGPDVRLLARGPMTAIDGERPIAYVRYGNGALPDLAAHGDDLLFWSPEVERTVQMSDVVCSQWPAATLYRIGDDERLVLAARIGGAPWQPAMPADAWRTGNCAAPPRGMR